MPLATQQGVKVGGVTQAGQGHVVLRVVLLLGADVIPQSNPLPPSL